MRKSTTILTTIVTLTLPLTTHAGWFNSPCEDAVEEVMALRCDTGNSKYVWCADYVPRVQSPEEKAGTVMRADDTWPSKYIATRANLVLNCESGGGS